MQAIKTVYLGATNVRGARVKASAAAGSVILSWDHSLNLDGNHMAAAKALATKFGWNYGRWFSGWVHSKSDSFCIWICAADQRDSFTLNGER